MKKLDNPEIAQILFGDWEDTIIWSCLQGVMGAVFVDNAEKPQSALAKLGNQASFGFLAGKPNIALLESCRGEDIILVPQDDNWKKLIEDHYGEKAHSFIRYATRKDTSFDSERLQGYVEGLPRKFAIKAIDEQLYDACLQEDWSRDLIANYKDAIEYRHLGLGYAVLYENRVSSYSTYRDGIEIEIDTHPAYRRQGLAKIAGAKLILECLARGLYPSWDAHTSSSLQLAQKLGYQLSYEYVAYEVV